VFTLAETGTYFIGANSFLPNQFGGYTLTLTCSGGVAPPPTFRLFPYRRCCFCPSDWLPGRSLS